MISHTPEAALYDAKAFLKSLPGPCIAYCQVAGHYQEDADLIFDTHGAAVTDPVCELPDKAYAHYGVLRFLIGAEKRGQDTAGEHFRDLFSSPAQLKGLIRAPVVKYPPPPVFLLLSRCQGHGEVDGF